MPKYAFGTAGRDESIGRHDANQIAKQRNISDLLNGVGVLAQSLGAMHRYKQEQANKDVLADFYVRSLANPEGQPISEPAPGAEGPVQRQPWDQAIGQKLQEGRQPAGSFLEGLGNYFSPEGKLTGDDAIKLADSIRGRQAQQAELAMQERKVKVDEFGAALALKKQETDRAQGWAKLGVDMLGAKAQMRTAGLTQENKDNEILKNEQARGDKMETRISTLNQRAAEAERYTLQTDPSGALTIGFLRDIARDTGDDNQQMKRIADDALMSADPKVRAAAKDKIQQGLRDEAARQQTRLDGVRAASKAYQDRVVAPAIQRVGGTPARAAAPVADPLEAAGRKWAEDNSLDFDTMSDADFQRMLKALQGGE